MRVWFAMLLLIPLLANAQSAERPLKYEEPKSLTAEIYAGGNNPPKLLYKFRRTATRSGSTLRVQRDYLYPDGRLAAREKVVYEGDSLVLYELDEDQIGATGVARIRRDTGRIEFEYGNNQEARPSTRDERLSENTLINDMVGVFLRSNWDALEHGKKVKCRYIVIPRKETVGFTFVKEKDSTWKGRAVSIIKMEASSRIIAMLVDPLYFTVEKAAPHRVLEYAGRTTPKIQVNGKWEDLDAVTVFDWESAR